MASPAAGGASAIDQQNVLSAAAGRSAPRKSGEFHPRAGTPPGPEPPTKRGKASADQAAPTAVVHVLGQPTAAAAAAAVGPQAPAELPLAGGALLPLAVPGARLADESSGNSSDTRNGSGGDNGGGEALCTSSSGSGASLSQPLALPMSSLPQRPSPLSGHLPAVALLPPIVPMDMAGAAAGPPVITSTPAGFGAPVSSRGVSVKTEGGPASGGAPGGGGPSRGLAAAADGSVPRRVIANRQSAARSKERRRGYVIGLEQSVKNLTLQISQQQGHLHSLASNSATLCTANYALTQHARGLEDRLRTHECQQAEMAALRHECDRLRHLALSASAGTPLETQVTASLPPASAASGADGTGGDGGGNEAQSEWHEAPGEQQGASQQQGSGQQHTAHGQRLQPEPQQQQRQSQPHGQQAPQHQQEQQQLDREREPSPLPHIRGGGVGGSTPERDSQPPEGASQPPEQPLDQEPVQQPEQGPNQGRSSGQLLDDTSNWEQYMDWGDGGGGSGGLLHAEVPSAPPPQQLTPMDEDARAASAPAVGAPAAAPSPVAALDQAPPPPLRRPSIQTGDTQTWRSGSLGNMVSVPSLPGGTSRAVLSGSGSGSFGGAASGVAAGATAAAAALPLQGGKPPPPRLASAALLTPLVGAFNAPPHPPLPPATSLQWCGAAAGLPALPVHWPPGFDAAAVSAAAAAVAAAGPAAFMIPPPALQPLLRQPSAHALGAAPAGLGAAYSSGSLPFGTPSPVHVLPVVAPPLPPPQLQPTKVQSAPVAPTPASLQAMTPAELDALIARYAAAAPPGSRAREQAARVQDVASLRLSSAPGSMQIRIAGLPSAPAPPQGGQQPVAQATQAQLPPFHQQAAAAAQAQQSPAPEAAQPQAASGLPPFHQPSAAGAGDTIPMEAATTESLDMDQMADLLDSFVVDGAHFPEL